jgi:UDP-glucuronate 4-epimerase
MSSYLVTGAAGFIGAKVCNDLLKAGNRVVGIDNLNDYYDVRLKEWRLAQLSEEFPATDFYFERLDIEDQSSLEKLFKQNTFDAVLHFAARAGVRYSLENPHVYASTNVSGTLNLLECMRAKTCNKMVMASTSSLYAGESMPFNEDLSVNEPLSPYAASKKAAELFAYSYHKLYGFDISILRYFTVYGPAGRPDMSPFRFVRWAVEGDTIKLFGDGSQSRDFTFIDDIVRGTVMALKKVGYEIINLGAGRKPISLNSMIEKLDNLLGKSSNIERKLSHLADMNETWADINKATSLLGWKPEFSFDEGLKKTVEWYLVNREWLKEMKI